MEGYLKCICSRNKLMYCQCCALYFSTKSNGTVGSFHSPTSSAEALPKAFQTNTACSFGFFNAPQLTKASFRRFVALKKPLICMRGFVANIGASLEEFAVDVRTILLYNSQKKMLHTIVGLHLI
jgi:hypothetical protein